MSSESRVKNLPPYFIAFVGAMVAIGPLSIDTYLPALPTMAGYFDVGIEQVNYTIITYVIGYALAQLIGGPISDQIGRKKIGTIGLCIFIPSVLLITATQSIGQIQALRMVQAFGGGFASIICVAMIRDSYSPEEAARRYPMVMMIMLLAPLIAPLIGTLLLPFGWQSIFVFLAVYAVVLIFFFQRIPETAPDITGKVSFRGIFPQYKEVISRRIDDKLIPVRIVLAVGLSAGCLLVFITNVSFIYLVYFDLSTNLFPLFFGINIVMMMLLNGVTMKLIKTIKPYKIFRVGLLIQLLAIGSLALTVFLVTPPLWLFTLLMSITIGCAGLISPSATAFFMSHFDRLAGSAASVMSVTMFTIGAPLGALTQVFFTGTTKPIVLVMLCSSVLANIIAATIPDSDKTTNLGVAEIPGNLS